MDDDEAPLHKIVSLAQSMAEKVAIFKWVELGSSAPYSNPGSFLSAGNKSVWGVWSWQTVTQDYIATYILHVRKHVDYTCGNDSDSAHTGACAMSH